MRISGSHLAQKETEILSAVNAIENKTLALRTAEDEALFKKITAGAYIRQATLQARDSSSRQHNASFRPYSDMRENIGSVAVRQNEPARIESAGYTKTLPPSPPSSGGAYFGSDADRRVVNELKSIRRSLAISKLATAKSSAANRSSSQFTTTDYNYDWQGL